MTSGKAKRSSKKKTSPLADSTRGRSVFVLRPSSLVRRFSSIVVPLFFFCLAAIPAHADFYTLNQRWEKSNSGGKPKANALEQSFGAALAQPSSALPGIPPPTTIEKPLTALTQGGITELQQSQSLIIEQGGGIIKFLTTDEGVVTIESINSETLRVIGTDIGHTFVHIWNAQGRNTFEIRVIPQKFVTPASQLKQLEAFEKNRSFKVGYDVNRSAYYTGPQVSHLQRDSMDLDQNFTLNGDTPYGELDSHALFQKDRAKTVLTDAQVRLLDGKIGPYQNFNAALGDSQIKPNLMVFPSARVRGADVYHWDDPKNKRLTWEGFYGREEESIIGTITPGLLTKRTTDSFLGGGVMDFKVNDDAKIKGGYFTGAGKDRTDELNRNGMALSGDFKLGPHVKFDPEVDYDNERFAQTEDTLVKLDRLAVKHQYRNIDRHFETLIGSPSRQGEIGNVFEVDAQPSDNTNFQGSIDIFRDRLIPNPDDPGAANVHQDATLTIIPWDRSSLIFNYQDFDDTGRIGPTRERSFSSQYNQQVEWFGHKYSFFSRYQNRGTRILTNSANNYVLDQVLLGVETTLFWGIDFSIQQEWDRLKEPNVPRLTFPHALVYTFNYRHQIGNSPFYMDTSLRIRDEENTESPNSFMTGTDSTELTGGLYYREIENMELFLTGTLTDYVPESSAITEPRVEAEFLTGMRYVYDTNWRWSAVGSFQGMVFKDLNGNGRRDSNEPGIPSMIVHSSDGKEARTDAQGFYSIKDVSGKHAELSLDSSNIPYGFAPTSSTRQEVEIVQNRTVNVDFGLTPRSEITGIIYNDLNDNGKYDEGEPGVRKIRLTLENGLVARSTNLGVYSFSDVIAGDHVVTLDVSSLPEGYLPRDIPRRKITVHEGIRYELPFPLRAVRIVTGQVFIDKNGDSVVDEGEKTLAGVKVRLGTLAVTTDKDGWYLFDSVAAGDFELSVDASGLPTGLTPPASRKIQISNEPTTLTINLGASEAKPAAAPAETKTKSQPSEEDTDSIK